MLVLYMCDSPEESSFDNFENDFERFFCVKIFSPDSSTHQALSEDPKT